MKTLTLLLVVSGMLVCGCEGPPGPTGFPGRDGLDGANGEESYAFEYQLDFTAPDYNVLLNLPNDFTMLDSDILMVYFLWKVEDGVEIWRALPQTLYFVDGMLNYNFDFSKYDVNVFLDGTVNFDGLIADYTDQWIARVVVIPAQFTGGRMAVDYSDYDQVKALLDLPSSSLATTSYRSRPAH